MEMKKAEQVKNKNCSIVTPAKILRFILKVTPEAGAKYCGEKIRNGMIMS